MWTPTYLQSWSQFVPGFENVDSNVEYIEAEDEFDIKEKKSIDFIELENGESIDFLTMPLMESTKDTLLLLPLMLPDIK